MTSTQDPLNFFEPYQSLPPTHENQLTRALLVVLRFCPMAHEAWLKHIDSTRSLLTLPRPTFATQCAKVLWTEEKLKSEEPIPGISVICAAESYSTTANVMESD